MDSKASASSHSLLNQSHKWRCLVNTAWVTHTCTPAAKEAGEVFLFSISGKHKQVTCEIPQTKDRFSKVLFRQKPGTFLLDGHQHLSGKSAMDLEATGQEKWMV